jgi:hypothetical protein
VTVADGDIVWDEEALEALLNSPDGPVGQMLAELASQAAAVARAAAPVQTPRTYSWGKKHSTSYMPWSGGYTKANVRAVMGYTKGGTLFGGVNAPYGPTLFLEKPAKQMHHSYPFLTTGLYSLSI